MKNIFRAKLKKPNNILRYRVNFYRNNIWIVSQRFSLFNEVNDCMKHINTYYDFDYAIISQPVTTETKTILNILFRVKLDK